MSFQQPFAVTLSLAVGEEPCQRALSLIRSLKQPPAGWLLRNLDSTGDAGDTITKKLNQSGCQRITHDEFCALLADSDQIIELDVLGVGAATQPIMGLLIADGRTLDWLGFGSPLEIACPGEFKEVSCADFLWPGENCELGKM